MILITGATGGLGKETIKALLKKISASEIVGLARDKEKAEALSQLGIEVRIGDYDDYPSLLSAFTGIDKVLAVSAAAFSDRVTQEKNVIDAASASGVKHVIFTSIQRKEGSGFVIPYVTEANFIVEEYLKKSGLKYTILKNTLYADTLPFLLGDVLNDGIHFPAGNGRVAFATRKDLGEGIAAILAGNDFEDTEITLANSVSWSFDELAAAFSRLASGTIAFEDQPRDLYVRNKEALGIPKIAAEFAADWAAAAKAGEFEEAPDTLEKLLGRKPTGIRAYLEEAFFNLPG